MQILELYYKQYYALYMLLINVVLYDRMRYT